MREGKSELMMKLEEIRKIDINKRYTPEEMEERRRKINERRSHQQRHIAQTGEEPVPAARPSLPQGTGRTRGFNMELLRKFNTTKYWKNDGKEQENQEHAAKNDQNNGGNDLEEHEKGQNKGNQSVGEKEFSVGVIKLQPVQEGKEDEKLKPVQKSEKEENRPLFSNLFDNRQITGSILMNKTEKPMFEISEEKLKNPSNLFSNPPPKTEEKKEKEEEKKEESKPIEKPVSLFGNIGKTNSIFFGKKKVTQPQKEKEKSQDDRNLDFYTIGGEKVIRHFRVSKKSSQFQDAPKPAQNITTQQPIKQVHEEQESTKKPKSQNPIQNKKQPQKDMVKNLFSQAPPKDEQKPENVVDQKIEVKEIFPQKMPNGPQGEQVFLLQNVTDNSKNQENDRNNNGLFSNAPLPSQNIFGNNNNTRGISNLFSMNKPAQEEVEQPSSGPPLLGSKPEVSVGLFGSSKPSDFPSGLFGNKAQKEEKNAGLFGQTQKAEQKLGFFSNKPQEPSGNIFNENPKKEVEKIQQLFGVSKPQESQGALFGGKKQKEEQTQGIFNTKPQESSGNLFSKKPKKEEEKTKQLFGSSNPQEPQGALFGGKTQKEELFSAKPQEQPTSLFGGKAQEPTGGLFGNSTKPKQPSGLFSSNKPQQSFAVGFFGTKKPQEDPASNIFTSKSQEPSATIFGGRTQQPSGIFGTGSQPSAGLFGQKASEKSASDVQKEFLQKAITGGSFAHEKNSLFSQSGSLFSGKTPNTFGGASLFSGQNEAKEEDEDEQDDNEPIQADEENFDPSKSTGNYDGYSQSKILFKDQCTKFRQGGKDTLQNLTVSLEQFQNSDKTYLIVRMANKRPVITSTILSGTTTVRILNNSTKNLHLQKLLIQEAKVALIDVKIQFKDEETGKKCLMEIEKAIGKKKE